MISISLPLWLDLPDGQARASLRSNDLADECREHAMNLIRDGFTIVRGVVDPALCDDIVWDYREYCRKSCAYSDKYVDGRGFHSWLVNVVGNAHWLQPAHNEPT